LKIYLSNEINENYEAMGYLRVDNINSIDYIAEDSECTSIIIDTFLNKFAIVNVPEVLFKVVSKLRINSEITIIDNDIDLIANNYTRGIISFMELNEHYFKENFIRSFIRLEDIEDMLSQSGLVIKSKQLRNNTFTIIYKREVKL
jgi:hypothetical protein